MRSSETDALEEAFHDFVGSLPEPLRAASTRLSRQIELNPGCRVDGWLAQFNLLTLFYPTLQAEGFPQVARERVLRINLGHVLLIVHAIIEDRQLDDQIALMPSELMLSKTFFQAGLGILYEEAGSGAPEMAKTIHGILTDYACSQLLTYTEFEKKPHAIRGRCDPAALAAGRASVGFLGVLALCSAAGATQDMSKCLRAFDALTIGLQWWDDIDDWPGDFKHGQKNLLLHELHKDHDPQLSAGESGKESWEVRRDLLSRGIVRKALGSAHEEMEAAVEIQSSLGCHQLAEMIEEQIKAVRAKRQAFRSMVGEGILSLIAN